MLASLVQILWLLGTPPVLTIQWTTSTEQNTAGFQLYRSLTPDGDFLLLTPDIIPSQGSSVTGHTYKYTDHTIEANRSYHYLLEEVEFNGNRTQHTDDIFSGQATTFSNWQLLLIGLTLLVGFAFLVAAFLHK